MSGNMAVQHVKAGLEAIYVSGWQVAADANLAGQTYPDQSLYPSNSVPALVQRINQALLRADQIEVAEGKALHHWLAPIIADAEAGFGGPLHAHELTKSMIAAGAAAVHFEDQLAAEKKCGHLGGKVLVPTQAFINTLVAARLAADVMDVPTLIVARTDADAAKLLTSDIDERDREFIVPGERTPEGFFKIRGGVDAAIARARAYAPYADLLWCETSTPNLGQARRFAEAVQRDFPGKLLAYNCSPSFNWKQHLGEAELASFQRELGAMGYKFQFVTLAGFHAMNHAVFELARAYKEGGMAAYAALQIRLVELGEDAMTEQVLDGRLDIGFMYFPAADEPLACRVVSRRRQWVAMAPDHPLATRATLTLRDLAGVLGAALAAEGARIARAANGVGEALAVFFLCRHDRAGAATAHVCRRRDEGDDLRALFGVKRF